MELGFNTNIIINSKMYVYNPYNPSNVPITKLDIKNILKQNGVDDYEPIKIELYQEAFVHSSYVKLDSYNNPLTGEPAVLADIPSGCMGLQPKSYERMEFLGDKELDKVVTNYVFMRFESADEHFLSKLRSRIVNNETIGTISKKLGFGKFLVISKKLETYNVKSGKELVPFRENIGKLSDIFEAFIGALWLDSRDTNLIYKFVTNIIEKHIDIVELISADNNYKEIFQKHCQKNMGFIPVYKDIGSSGEGIHKIYTVAVDETPERRFSRFTNAALISSRNNGCGRSGRLLNSGWA
jgi:dsRNA-specific ribonuclease